MWIREAQKHTDDYTEKKKDNIFGWGFYLYMRGEAE
jgi:hypothetical protein